MYQYIILWYESDLFLITVHILHSVTIHKGI